MSVNATNLADEIRSAMGYPTPVSAQLTGWASGLLDELTISGSATSGGSAGPHPVSGLTGASMSSRVISAGGAPASTPQILSFCTAMSDYINAAAVVTYTGPSPPAVPDWFAGGTISGMIASAMATAIAASVPFPLVSTKLLAECTAIVSHIQSNAQVASGTIS